MSVPYARSVFTNCPFTDDFTPIFRAYVFAIVYCGYRPRSAREIIDGGDIRLQKIENLIEQSKFGIHDISNMELDADSGLPRFNMPLELGVFLGAKRFGDGSQKEKRLIILDSDQYRYQQAISDISGQDIECHNGDPADAIRCVRHWLRAVSRRTTIPGPARINSAYAEYEADLPQICDELQYDLDDLTFNDLWETMVEWQKARADER